MSEQDKIQLFEDQKIRTAWDAEAEEWYFSVVDVKTGQKILFANEQDAETYGYRIGSVEILK